MIGQTERQKQKDLNHVYTKIFVRGKKPAIQQQIKEIKMMA